MKNKLTYLSFLILIIIIFGITAVSANEYSAATLDADNKILSEDAVFIGENQIATCLKETHSDNEENLISASLEETQSDNEENQISASLEETQSDNEENQNLPCTSYEEEWNIFNQASGEMENMPIQANDWP